MIRTYFMNAVQYPTSKHNSPVSIQKGNKSSEIKMDDNMNGLNGVNYRMRLQSLKCVTI